MIDRLIFGLDDITILASRRWWNNKVKYRIKEEIGEDISRRQIKEYKHVINIEENILDDEKNTQKRYRLE